MHTKDFKVLLESLGTLTPAQQRKLRSTLDTLTQTKITAPSSPLAGSLDKATPEKGEHVIIYTDGACSGNPGPGGWGATLVFGGKRRDLKGGEGNTTNNRMEVLAAIEALDALKKPCDVELWTDSTYLRKGITEWIHGWKRNGWKTAAKKPVKNADLWQRLDELRSLHRVDWHWVKGHSGHPENERADELARAGMEPYKS